MDDPQVGMKWVYPKCIKCKFNERGMCKKFGVRRMEVEVDIYACPEFEPNEREERKSAFDMFGIGDKR